jgi:hypothetical protein
MVYVEVRIEDVLPRAEKGWLGLDPKARLLLLA